MDPAKKNKSNLVDFSTSLLVLLDLNLPSLFFSPSPLKKPKPRDSSMGLCLSSPTLGSANPGYYGRPPYGGKISVFFWGGEMMWGEMIKRKEKPQKKKD